MADGAVINSATGTIILTAPDNITLGQLVSTNNTSIAVWSKRIMARSLTVAMQWCRHRRDPQLMLSHAQRSDRHRRTGSAVSIWWAA